MEVTEDKWCLAYFSNTAMIQEFLSALTKRNVDKIFILPPNENCEDCPRHYKVLYYNQPAEKKK